MDNPAIKLKIATPEAKVHIWTDAELTTMLATADEMGLENVGTAILIAHDEGPRFCDVLSHQRHRDNIPAHGMFRYFQTKTDEYVISPVGQRVRKRPSKQPTEQFMLVLNTSQRSCYQRHRQD
jgi:hypothetical protein